MEVTGARRSRAAPPALVVTCEHGGNTIPAEYRPLFRGYRGALESHRGYDPGALLMARELARTYRAPLVASTVSRLLVELNRSPHHRALYSDRTRSLSPTEKARIVARYYDPYRQAVETRIRGYVRAGRRVLHVSSHSFTPVLDGETRETDVGILYDPKRALERELCTRWTALLAARIAPLRVRRNYPYRGYNDGLTTFLRRRFPERAYAGVEIEVNQKHARTGGSHWRVLRRQIVASVGDLLNEEAT